MKLEASMLSPKRPSLIDGLFDSHMVRSKASHKRFSAHNAD